MQMDKVYATATEDMDALTFRTPKLLRKLTFSQVCALYTACCACDIVGAIYEALVLHCTDTLCCNVYYILLC
jgi:hypothetical protein